MYVKEDISMILSKKTDYLEQQEKFEQRGKYEKEAIEMAGHITGRTDFDREYVDKTILMQKSHFMNETLRE